MNGTVPGPFGAPAPGPGRRVAGDESSRGDHLLHWRGLIVPPDMNGVYGVSFPDIKSGETFAYCFPVRQR